MFQPFYTLIILQYDNFRGRINNLEANEGKKIVDKVVFYIISYCGFERRQFQLNDCKKQTQVFLLIQKTSVGLEGHFYQMIVVFINDNNTLLVLILIQFLLWIFIQIRTEKMKITIFLFAFLLQFFFSFTMTDAQNFSHQQLKPLIINYYPIRGVAQPIRILCAYLEVDYIDNYIVKNQENQIETGFRIGLPMLEDGNLKIHEQIAIMNYLCMKTSKQYLLGLTPQNSAKINELLFKYSVQKKKIMSSIMQGLKYLQDHNLNKKQVCQKTLKKIVQECKFVEVCLRKVSKNKKYVFDYITVIDFLFYQICFYIDGFYKELVTKDSQYYGFIKFKNQFEKQDFFQKNKDKIGSNPLFFQFTSPSLNVMVSKLWKGTNNENLFVKNVPYKS